MWSANIITSLQNPKHFERPEVFNPDRFMDRKDDKASFNFIPFSSGPHNCIGQHMALLEA
jgi:cytochrome P450